MQKGRPGRHRSLTLCLRVLLSIATQSLVFSYQSFQIILHDNVFKVRTSIKCSSEYAMNFLVLNIYLKFQSKKNSILKEKILIVFYAKEEGGKSVNIIA